MNIKECQPAYDNFVYLKFVAKDLFHFWTENIELWSILVGRRERGGGTARNLSKPKRDGLSRWEIA